ncbi:hypothetical protein ES703_77073 [subsurface metagenome]
MIIMSNFEKVEVKLGKDILHRLKKISEILDISLYKVINTSLLDGIFPLWIPYQKLLSDISDKENLISEEDYQDVLDELSTQINSDFENIQRLDSLEDKFETQYPFGLFKDLQERKTEFIKFIKTYKEVEEEKAEEAVQEPVQKEIKEVPIRIDSAEEEEEIPSSLFSRFKSFIKSQIDSHINNLVDVFILGIFLILLGLINFFIFYSLYLTWPFMFDFRYMITTYVPWISVISIIMVILLFPIMILITGFIIGKLYYHFIKIFRKEKQH